MATHTYKFLLPLALRVTESCNLACSFCMNPSMDHAPMRAGPEFAAVMKKVRDSGLVGKVTFTGGEPLLCADLPEMVATCSALGFETTVTTNATLLSEDWLAKAKPWLSFLGVSIDTLDDSINRKQGRWSRSHLSQAGCALAVIKECAKLGVPYKVNTVVTSLNAEDYTLAAFLHFAPGELLRWKVMRCAAPPTARPGARNLCPTDEQWRKYQTFVHSTLRAKTFFEDRSDTMESYLLMTSDWKLEVIGGETARYTRSLADPSVSVADAVAESGFDGGQYARFRNLTSSHGTATCNY